MGHRTVRISANRQRKQKRETEGGRPMARINYIIRQARSKKVTLLSWQLLERDCRNEMPTLRKDRKTLG